VALLSAINDRVSRAATTAERTLLGALQGGCAAPVGAYAGGTDVLRLDGLVVAADGGMALRGSASGALTAAEELGRQVAADLLSRGAARCMAVSGTAWAGGQLTSGDDDK
jgi:hydroxymethylbilane synthase